MRLDSAEVFLMGEILNVLVRVCSAVRFSGNGLASEPLMTLTTLQLSGEGLQPAQLVGRAHLSWFHACVLIQNCL